MVSPVPPQKRQNFHSKNLDFLKQRSPKLAAYVQTKTPGIEVTTTHTRSGHICSALHQGSRLIHLHSAYNPIAEAEYWANQVGKEDWQIGVIFGVGLGYHIEALQQLFPERSLVVIEPIPDIFNMTLHLRDLKSLMRHKNYPILLSKEPHDAAISLFENHLRRNVLKGRIEFLPWPPYQRIWPAFWQQLQQQVGDLARQAYVNVGTYQYFSMVWQENFFTNLRSSATDPSVKSLYSLFQQKPAILVSAGPSLQKNIHLLAELQEKALIVAAGSAIGPLLAHGIKPHLVISFDGGAANYYVFANLDTQDMILVYSSVIYPRIIAEHKGPRFALGVDIYPFERWFFEQLGQDRGAVASGPSIANLSWDLLRQMGCDPIIFIGQDLAYGDTGQTHAAGHVQIEHMVGKSDSTASTQPAAPTSEWVEDIWGNQVRTTLSWLTMKIWFEQHIRAWGNNRTFIDATEGGAKIEGTQIMTLQDTINQYCQESFSPRTLILETYRCEAASLAPMNLNMKLDPLLQQVAQELDQVLKTCDEAVSPLRELDEKNRTSSLTASDFARFQSRFTHLENQLSTSEVYNHFVSASIKGSQSAFSAMSARLQTEVDLLSKGKHLMDLYTALFSTVHKTTLEIQSYHRLAEEPTPYAPPSFASEIDQVTNVLHLMHPLVDRLKSLSAMTMDEAVGNEATSIHYQLDKLSAEISQTEIMRRFVKDILERDLAPMQHLNAVSALVDRESDLKRKAEHLAEFHALFLQIIEDAMVQIRTYSQHLA